ncbi:unnamed protein product [Somion occarium]|uniref:C3H1-type domain-containing protein n=1 Tax=Somion occarium TaxID=3059160 RepID=A0ABP1D3N8_9APHY
MASDSGSHDGTELEIDYHIKELLSGLSALRARQQQAEAEATELREQLEIERRGFRALKEDFVQERDNWKIEKKVYEGHISALKDSDRRVVCLIDGDGTIFSPSYLAQGQIGGHNAAQALVEHIRDYLLQAESVSSSSYELTIYCFLHKKGLAETLGKAGYGEASALFDEFIAGFNQAGHRFLMVDVGAGKENADSKLRAFLADHVRSPSTWKIFLGASHDNGYVPELRSLIAHGQSEKLVLLPGYSEIAFGIKQLGLPSLLIPGLFLDQKINLWASPRATPSRAGTTSVQSSPLPAPSRAATRRGSDAGYFTPATRSRSRAASVRRSSTSLSEVSDSSVSPESSPSQRTASITSDTDVSQGRSPPVNVPLNKLRPAPCNSFYLLKNCENTACSYSHSWVLSPQLLATLSKLAKNAPCHTLISTKECSMGEQCIYSHRCPRGPNCHFKKKGYCKFKLAGMHDEASD